MYLRGVPVEIPPWVMLYAEYEPLLAAKIEAEITQTGWERFTFVREQMAVVSKDKTKIR